MSISHHIRAGVLAVLTLVLPTVAQAQDLEKRVALVIGNGAYQAGPLSTPANDAGLIAQTLQAAGFDVVGARDLDTTTLRSSFREFLDKVGTSGSDTVAVVYFAGHAVQFEGENYLVPVDARFARDSDVPIEAFRLSDLTRPLATMPLKARIVILDAARANNFAKGPQPLAGGLALVQPDDGMLIAFNSAPGTIGPDSIAAYGAYATALSEMIKEGGLTLNDVFERVRLRVNEVTGGSEIPWNASRIQAPFVFFERTNTAPQAQADNLAEIGSKPIAQLDARDAYLAALARDSFRGYQDFLAAYPDDPLAKRVRAILAARREAATWRESANIDTPEGYWSYLRRYPRGPHAREAQRRLNHFAAALEPPADFAGIEYDIPAPPPEEFVFVERPVMYYGDPVYDLPPPPPVPTTFLPPQPAYYVDYPPPPPSVDVFVLPTPIYHPVPIWVERPAYVVPPPVNILNVNIHNIVVIDERTQTAVVTNPGGQQVPLLPANLLPRGNGFQAGAAPANNQSGFVQRQPAVSAAIAATAVALPTLALRNRQQPIRANAPAQLGIPGQALPGQGVPIAPRGASTLPIQQPTLRPLPDQPRPNGSPQLRPQVKPQIAPIAGAQPLPVPSNRPASGGTPQRLQPLLPPQAGPRGSSVQAPQGQANAPADRALPKPALPMPTAGQGNGPMDKPLASPALPVPSTSPAISQRLRKPNPSLAQPPDRAGTQPTPVQNMLPQPDRQRQNATQQQQLLMQRQQAAQQRLQQQQAGQQRAQEAAAMRAQRQQADQRQAQQAAQRAEQQRAMQQQAQQQRAMQQQAQQRAMQQQAQQRAMQQQAQQQRAMQQQAQQRAMQQQAQQRAMQQQAQQRAMQQQAQQQRAMQQQAQQQRAMQQQAQQRAMQQQAQQRAMQARPNQPGKRPACGGPGQAPCQ
jgi:uncharacterized caspase-like protein